MLSTLPLDYADHRMCCVEKVSQLINHPVMSLFGTRMSGTSTELVSHRVQQEIPPTTHGHDKESLPKNTRSGFISTVFPDLTQLTHWLKEKETLEDILFLRLKVNHLRPEYRVLNSIHYALL
jgi:hypothetical protein